MDKYLVTLQAEEIKQLRAFAAKGKHAAQKVINALILLKCDESQGRQSRRTNLDIAQVLQVSERKIARLKRRLVEEGLEVALNGQAPQRKYVGKIDGESRATSPQGHGAAFAHD